MWGGNPIIFPSFNNLLIISCDFFLKKWKFQKLQNFDPPTPFSEAKFFFDFFVFQDEMSL